ncbi:MAG: hypothetical protein LC808_06125 [Actinobacteria bacterium]|nr:hypothetical protein [Actinomycetota bacterium]
MLLRYRPGVVGERGRMVHMMPLPGGGQTGAAGVALCGALLRPDLVEMVTPGHGAPCTLCLVNHVSADPPLADTSASIPPADAHSDVRPLQAAVGYRAWDWPVTLRGEHVWLTLEPDTAALMIPVPLVTQMSTILRQRHCPPLVLSHPEVPGHRVVLAGEPYDVGLPWPPMVQRIGGVFPLPPTVTCAGPVIWVHPPVADALRLCREVDVFAALRSALRTAPI